MSSNLPHIELWNVHDGVPLKTDAQRTVNVLGRVADPEAVREATYRLNDGPWRPVFFCSSRAKAQRLAAPGDFNIDTIDREELLAQNKLEICLVHAERGRNVATWHFPVQGPRGADASFRLALENVEHVESVGQAVDGRWQIAGDGTERWIGIAEQDAGLDRVLLFATDGFTIGYRIRARLRVTRWVGYPHNVGLVFKWNPHLRGTGQELPSQWSTGLGYYYSECLGLRIRVGVDVHLDASGRKLGDHVLAETPLSPWRYWASRITRRFTRPRRLFPQLVPNRDYRFELEVGERRHALTVWRAERPKPSPNLVVDRPPALLQQGAPGIIAHRCGVRVYEFEVEPHPS